MTQEAYRSFYNDEYRKFIYRWFPAPPKDAEDERRMILEIEGRHTEKLLELMHNEDFTFPDAVLDWGCYKGGMLDVFRSRGCKTYGIEFNAEARAEAEARGHVVFASLQDAIAAGIKVNFVIMQDVIEHLLDIREVADLHKVMAPEAYLYVFTPGMFRTDPFNYWQLAHVWYFVANTFGWLMEELGFTPTYIDEDITSFWQWQGSVVHMDPPAGEWAEYIIDEAEGKEERKLPPFRGVCKFTKKLLYDNMRRNFALKPPDIYDIRETCSGPIAIVGGGPSIEGQVGELKHLKDRGVPVIAISRMYPWCLNHGIVPDYVVSLDCMEEQEAGFATIHPDTTHFMASVARPEILERIQKEGGTVYLFDSRDDRKIKKLRRDAGYRVATVINAGGTVVITCISVALTLGYTDLHIFGFDCMFPGSGKTHATGIAGESVEQKHTVVEVQGQLINTTPSFIEFAHQALDLFSVAHDEHVLNGVQIYGDSLITRLWDCKWYNEDGTEQVRQ
jgi:hypothetical protein